MRYSLIATGGMVGNHVTLEEAKLHLRLDGNDEDTLLLGLLAAAKEKAEAFTERCLGYDTFRITFHELPAQPWRPGRNFPPAVIKLPKTPLVSVQRVAYRGADGTEQVIPPADYTVDVESEPGRVVLHNGWPSVDTSRPGVLTVDFTAGYPDAAKLPASIRAAMLLIVGHLYENREAGALDDSTVAYLLGPYRVEGFV